MNLDTYAVTALFVCCGDFFLSQKKNTFRFFFWLPCSSGFLPHMQEKKQTLFYSPAQFHVKYDPCTLCSNVVKRQQVRMIAEFLFEMKVQLEFDGEMK